MSVQETNLKAIADAIREKEGSVGAILAKEFPARIKALPSGGLPENVYTITVQASDPEGGSVSGGGVASKDMTVTVKSTVADGYQFGGWKEDGAVVSQEAEYSFQVEKNRSLTAEFEVPASRLPEGYTEVEYIHSGGSTKTGGINIGVKEAANTLKIELDVEIEEFTGGNRLISAYTSSNPKFCFVTLALESSKESIYCGLGSWTGTLTPAESLSGRKTKFIVDGANKKAVINNSEFLMEDVGDGVVERIYIGAYSTSQRFITGKWYGAKIYKSNELICNLVPCINPGGVAGFYDIIQNEFRQRTGGDTVITPGPAV